jgi:hypothetical protein
VDAVLTGVFAVQRLHDISAVFMYNSVWCCLRWADNICSAYEEEVVSRDSAVGIATGYRLDDQGVVGVRVPVASRILSSPRRPDRLWDPPGLLANGYRGLFLKGYSGRGVKLTTHLELVPNLRMVDLYIHSPIRLHGLVLTLLSTRITISLHEYHFRKTEKD